MVIAAAPVSVESLLPGLQMTHFSVCHRVANCRTRLQVLSCLKFIPPDLSAQLRGRAPTETCARPWLWSPAPKGDGCIPEGFSLRPDYLPKPPPLHTILLDVRLSTYEFRRNRSMQSITEILSDNIKPISQQ